MGKESRGLATWEWLTILAIFVGGTAGITVFAFQTFASISAVAEVKKDATDGLKEVKDDVKEMQRQQIHFMTSMGVRPLLKQ